MEYEVVGELYNVPLLDILVDVDFNCRGQFSLVSVDDLAKDIRERGLIEPLIIQPIEDVPEYERPEPCPWNFRLIAGHRRYMAIDQLTNMDKAPCCIRQNLSGEEAHALNFAENFEREDLNMLQEAVAIYRAWPDLAATEIKKKGIKRSVRWIRIRQKLMKMPEEVQTAAAIGRISQHEVEALATLEPEKILSSLRKLLATKGKEGQEPVIPGRQSWRVSRARGKKELGEMVAFLYMNQVFTSLTDRELALVNSVLAWAARGIDTDEFLVNRLDIPEDQVKIEEDGKTIEITYS